MFSAHFLLPAGFSQKIAPGIFKIKRERKNLLASLISLKSLNSRERFLFVLVGTESSPWNSKAQMGTQNQIQNSILLDSLTFHNFILPCFGEKFIILKY